MKLCALVMMLAVSSVHGQQVLLTGKVMDATGSALQGATVTLSKMKLIAVSGANGVYLITHTPVIHPLPSSRSIKGSKISGGVLRLTLDAEANLRVATYDVQGRLIIVLAQGWFPVGNHAIPLVPALPQHAGILAITIGNQQAFYYFVNMGHLSIAHFKTAPRPIEDNLAKTSALAVLDTLRAVGGGNSIKLFVYAYVDTMDFWVGGSDPYTEYRQQCMHRINYYRSTVGLGMLTRNMTGEACVDSQCQSDAASGTAHGAFGNCGESAQDECPNYGSLLSVVTGCLQYMWDEGPPPAGTPCGGSTTCYQQHGHYINMTEAYTRVACGFFVGSSGKVQAIQNFWR